MKKKVLLAALIAVALSSCNKNEMEGPDAPAANQLAEIKVGQTVEGLTKAAINVGDAVEAVIIATNGDVPEDWQTFVPVLENTFTQNDPWSAEKFANVSIGSFEAGNNQPVGLNPSLYASQDGATLTGIAPKGTVANGKVTFTVQDAQQDVMTAETTPKNAVSGGKIDPFSLTFKHRTAQLRFSFGATNADGNGAWENADIIVKSVTVKKAFVPQAVKLNELEMVWTKIAQNFLLDGFTKNVVTGKYDTDSNEADFVTVDKQALIKPGETVELDVVLTIDGVDKSYTAIKPMKDGNNLVTAEGKYHNISLTVKEPVTPTGTPEIIATATVEDWQAGDEGSAELK